MDASPFALSSPFSTRQVGKAAPSELPGQERIIMKKTASIKCNGVVGGPLLCKVIDTGRRKIGNKPSLAVAEGNAIPVINFSTSSWSSVRAEVRYALETYGCFEAIFGHIPLHQKMLTAVKEWFDLPLETRLKYPSNDRFNGLGNPKIPLWRNLGISDVLNHEVLERLTNLMWPEGNPSFSQDIYLYAKQGANLEQMVKKMILESFGVEEYYDSLKDSTYWIRVNQYRVPNRNETNLGLIEHTDSSFLTILTQNDVDGLEVQLKNGGWTSVSPSRASYTVLVGDALRAWSNGRLHAPNHRVSMNVDKMRYSIALFSYINGMIETPKELVDKEHPLLFKSFSHFGFRKFICTEEGQQAKSPIEAYCGM